MTDKVGVKTKTIRKKTTKWMVVLTFGVVFFVGILSATFYALQFISMENKRTQQTIETSASLLKNQIDNLNHSAVFLLSQEVVYKIYQTSEADAENENFYADYSGLQVLFNNMLSTQPLVDNLLLICENGEVYGTYATGLNYSLSDFENEFKQNKITWLPARPVSSKIATGDVIPVCIPIEYLSTITFSHEENHTMMLVLFLSQEKFNIEIERMNRSAFNYTFIANSEGVPINLPQDSYLQSIKDNGDYINLLQKGGNSSVVTSINDEIYNVIVTDLGVNDMKLVSVVSYQDMVSDTLNILIVTVIAIFIGLIAAILLSFKLSHTLTTPITQIMGQVAKMHRGKYKLTPIVTQATELRLLDESICEMSDTISRQIDEIRSEELYRRKAEMDALTEQINPHFLYNTLECCHFEVLSGNKESAANMIESLGKFLRLSLNKGNNTITLAEAVEHARQYLNIINFRKYTNVTFLSLLPKEAEFFRLPKMILQPLVENALIHGFNLNETTSILQPTAQIKIVAKKEEDAIIISVHDNGAGIDIEQAKRCLTDESKTSSDGHIGLKNVYKRLQYSFGDNVTIEFDSIPFYDNIVTIKIENVYAESEN